MAKEKQVKEEKLEAVLWAAADKLRGGVSPQDYMYVTLGLVFLKYLSDRFEIKHAELVKSGEGFEEDKDEYIAENIFWMPEKSRWSYVSKFSHQEAIGTVLDNAFVEIEKENKALRGTLNKTYSNMKDARRLGELVDLFTNRLNTAQYEGDFFGKIYEYFLGQFSRSLGQKGGEFYTPKCIVEILVNMIAPFKGRVYDPCCGSGGMFVQSADFVQEHQGNINQLSVYGQENEEKTWKLARINLAIRGIDANLGDQAADTFFNDQHPMLRADYILANPPFNISDYGQPHLLDDPRWIYGTPPKGNANYAWIQHIVKKLAPNGVAGFVLANGSLSTSGKEEYAIRKAMLEDGLVDAIVTLPTQLFSTVAIPVCCWFLRNNKGNKGRTLFIDARNMGIMLDRKTREITKDEINKIANTYHAWLENKNYEDVKGFCKSATIEDIQATDYSLVPGRYVGIDNSNEMTPEQIDAEIVRVKAELRELFKKDKELEDKIMKILDNTE